MEVIMEVPTLDGFDLGADEGVSGSLARARTGDTDGFHELFDRYSKPVACFIYNLLGNREQAEELTQETFIRAYARLHTMQRDTRFSTWLFGIARNVVREAVKEKYRNRRNVVMDPLVSIGLRDGRESPAESLIAGELSRTLQEAIAALSEDQRTVFVLKILHKLPYVEISRITGSSIGKLKTDLHRARLAMRERLGSYLGGQRAGN